MSNEKKKRGGWSNPASADNGRKATGGGRPRARIEFRLGEQIVIEDVKPMLGIVTSIGPNKMEVKVGDNIFVIRRPDRDEDFI